MSTLDTGIPAGMRYLRITAVRAVLRRAYSDRHLRAQCRAGAIRARQITYAGTWLVPRSEVVRIAARLGITPDWRAALNREPDDSRYFRCAPSTPQSAQGDGMTHAPLEEAEQHFSNAQDELERLQSTHERLRSALERYTSEERETRDAAKRGETDIEDLVRRQMLRTSTAELLDEAQADIATQETLLEHLRADIESASAVADLHELAAAHTKARAAFLKTIRSQRKVLVKAAEELTLHQRELRALRAAVSDALAVLGMPTRRPEIDVDDTAGTQARAILADLERRGIDLEAIQSWFPLGMRPSSIERWFVHEIDLRQVLVAELGMHPSIAPNPLDTAARQPPTLELRVDEVLVKLIRYAGGGEGVARE